MPSAHRRYASRTPARMLSAAAEIGPATAGLVEVIMRAKRQRARPALQEGLPPGPLASFAAST